MRALLIMALHLHLDPSPMSAAPPQPLLSVDVRLILRGINRYIHFRSEFIALDAADDMQRLADRELPVHSRSRDAHSLLTARLAEFVKFRAVEKLAENTCHLALYNPRPVIFDRDARLSEAIAHLHSDLGKDPPLLAGIESIIHCFFDSCDQCLRGRIKAEQVAILEKELGNRNFALPACHFDGGGWSKLSLRQCP